MSAETESSPPLRFGIVGARRLRQGLGPFIARDLAGLGHAVTAVLGRSEASAAAAADEVGERTGARPTPFTDRAAFLASGLDAVVVATPAGTHLVEVRAALAAGLHVLAEKPLLWHPETEWERTAAALEDEAHAAGVVLAANAQWPWTLPAWAELTGTDLAALRDRGAQSVRMGLTPASIGRQMIGDALPHPLSVAQDLRPDLTDAARITFEHQTLERRGAGAERMTVRAHLFGEAGGLDLEVVLESDPETAPRPAWIEVDGARADRCIRTSDYALFLRSGARVVDLPDPLQARIAAFCASVRGPVAGEPDRTLSRRARLLATLDAAWTAFAG